MFSFEPRCRGDFGSQKYTWTPVSIVNVDSRHLGHSTTPGDLASTVSRIRSCTLRAEVHRFMGHTDPRVTLKIYTHVTSDELPKPSSLPAIG